MKKNDRVFEKSHIFCKTTDRAKSAIKHKNDHYTHALFLCALFAFGLFLLKLVRKVGEKRLSALFLSFSLL